MEECIEIVEILVAESPVPGVLSARLTHIGDARAGVVGADRGSRETAEQLGDRLAHRLAEHIPQRDVEGRIAARLNSGRAEAEIASQVLGESIDGQWIASEHPGSQDFVEIGFDRSWREESFTQPDQAFVGVDMQPYQIREFLEPYRFYRCDLHAGAS